MSLDLMLAITDTLLGCGYMYKGDYFLDGLWTATALMSWVLVYLDYKEKH